MTIKQSNDLRIGDRVNVTAHRSEPGKGLSYDSLEGILLDDAGVSEGWDVVDVNVSGRTISVYCFSIVRR